MTVAQCAARAAACNYISHELFGTSDMPGTSEAFIAAATPVRSVHMLWTGNVDIVSRATFAAYMIKYL